MSDRVAVGVGIPISMGMGWEWEYDFPLWGSPQEKIIFLFSTQFHRYGDPYWDIHVEIHMWIPMGIPTEILWEWEWKFLSHGNPAYISSGRDFAKKWSL